MEKKEDTPRIIAIDSSFHTSYKKVSFKTYSSHTNA